MQANLPAIQGVDVMRSMAEQISIPLPDAQFQLPEFVSSEFKNEFIPDFDEETYHKDLTAVARGDILAFLRSPAHLVARRQKKDSEDSEPLRFGRLVHSLMLEPEKFKQNFIISPEFGDQRSAVNREKKVAWMKDVPPRALIVTRDDMIKMFGMAQSISRNKTACKLFEGASIEMTGYYRDPLTGLKCRVRPDMLNPSLGALIDLKTTRWASLKEFQRSAWDNRYDLQLGMYGSAVEAITGKRPEINAIIAVEKEPPYGCVVYALNEQMIEVGVKDYRMALSKISEHVQTNVWSGYAEEALELSLPPWAVLK